MRLIVGLGNPSPRYRRTRHNAGFMVVDLLASRAGVGKGRAEADAWLADAEVGGESVLLVKPLAFMNHSGVVVEWLLSRQRSGPQDMVVIVDDVALPLGSLRIRERGSHGGHNGLRSVIDVIGSAEFARLRIGVGTAERTGDLADYVLSEFSEEEIVMVQETVGYAGDAVECLIRDGVATAMNRYNGPRKV